MRNYHLYKERFIIIHDERGRGGPARNKAISTRAWRDKSEGGKAGTIRERD